MKLTSPNDVKRPDKPNVDHIIEEIEKKFENEDYIEHYDNYVAIKIQHHTNNEMMIVKKLYRERGWSDFKYSYINDHITFETTMRITFYF